MSLKLYSISMTLRNIASDLNRFAVSSIHIPFITNEQIISNLNLIHFSHYFFSIQIRITIANSVCFMIESLTLFSLRYQYFQMSCTIYLQSEILVRKISYFACIITCLLITEYNFSYQKMFKNCPIIIAYSTST